MASKDDWRVLVIDDDEELQHSYRTVLTPAADPAERLRSLVGRSAPLEGNYKVRLDLAAQGEAGCRLAEEALRDDAPYSLAIVDMRMPPGWNGLTTARRLRSLDPEIMIAIITAFSDHTAEEIHTEVGGEVFLLRKPFDLDVLRQLVRSACELWSSRRSLRASVTELSIANERAESSKASLCGFIANLSHEVRSPLHGIIGACELLGDTALAADQRQLVGLQRETANQVLRLVSDMLELSRLDAGGVQLRRQPTCPRALVDGVLRQAVLGKEDTLNIVHLKEGAVPAFVEIDPDRVRQVLLNLVGNAIKFAGQGRIAVGVHTLGAELVFFVSDEGGGVPEAQREMIFDRFRQGLSAGGGEHPEGAGLGLAICRDLAALMGGELSLDSGEGVGARFCLRLPLSRIEPPARNPGPQDALWGRRILVADDSRISRTLMNSVLTGAGADVDVVSDGALALAHLDSRPYHLVILDMRMPGVDGYEVLRRIAEDPKSPPVLAVTAMASAEDRAKILGLGAQHMLVKPVAIPELVSVASALLRSAALP
jgi:two-component system, sensor histidine kinase and response regulator